MASSTIHIGVKADTSGLTRGFSKGQKHVKGFARSVESAGSRMKSFGASARSAGTALATKFNGALLAVAGAALSARKAISSVNESLTRLDELAKRSRNLGIDPMQLEAIRLAAAELSGFDASRTDAAIERMVKRLGEASLGFGEAKSAIETMGLSLDDLVAATPDQQFAMIAKGLESIESRSQKVAIATKIFGRDAIGLVNTLDAGGGIVDDYSKALEDLGIKLSGKQLAAVESSNDAWGRLQLAGRGLVDTFTAELAPTLLTVAKLFLDAIPGPEGVGAAIKKMAAFIKKALPAAVSLVNIFISRIEFLGGVAMKAAGLVIQGFGLIEQVVDKFRNVKVGMDLSSLGKELSRGGGAAIDDSFTRFGDAMSGKTANVVKEAMEQVEKDLANAELKPSEPLIDLEIPPPDVDPVIDNLAKVGDMAAEVNQDFLQLSDIPTSGVEAFRKGTTEAFSAIQEHADRFRRSKALEMLNAKGGDGAQLQFDGDEAGARDAIERMRLRLDEPRQPTQRMAEPTRPPAPQQPPTDPELVRMLGTMNKLLGEILKGTVHAVIAQERTLEEQALTTQAVEELPQFTVVDIK